MPKGKTLLSLNRKEILELPGFKRLDSYLYTELKSFVRTQMRKYTTKKREDIQLKNILLSQF